MKIFLINKFLYPKGGDAIVTLGTGELLRAKGHEVIFWGMSYASNQKYPFEQLFVDNLDFNNAGGIKKQVDIALKLLYSTEAKNKIEQLIKLVGKPDIVHLHNFAHQISPSILHVFKKHSIPVVMTMHDYKLVCASYTLLSHGRLCEKCKGSAYFNCFREGCVKESKAKSLLNTAEMYLHHKLLHIYDLVDVFISPSQFLKDKVKEMGFKGKVVCIPNCVNPEEFIPGYEAVERSVCYVGRISHEKGIATLVEAIKGLDVKLKIIGDGPMREEIAENIKRDGIKNIELLGYKSGEELKDEVRKSMFVIIPSEWYEVFGLSIIESFALGMPVVAARIGGIPELVKDNETGLTFESGNAKDLREKIVCMLNNPAKLVEMGKAARGFVEQELNAEKHYERLVEVYKSVQPEFC